MIVIDPPSIREDLSKLVYDALGFSHGLIISMSGAAAVQWACLAVHFASFPITGAIAVNRAP
jgi:hypothetical protein